MFEF
jgi:hypothetical protein